MWSRNGAHDLDAANCYCRINPLFEAGSEVDGQLNEIVALGSVYRTKGGIGPNIFQVL